MQIKCEQLDELVMVRVSHNGSGPTPAWFLDEIRARQKVQRLPSITCCSMLHLLLQSVDSGESPCVMACDACLGRLAAHALTSWHLAVLC